MQAEQEDRMTLKVGLIGCGGITHIHVEGWKAIVDRAQIVAVADVSEENARMRAEQIGGEVEIYSDYNALLADAEIDAVDIALPHHLHRDAIVAAAEAGKHLMTEKPLCLTLDEAADIAKAVKEGGITMMAAHNQLFMPPMMRAKQMLLQGDLGRIYMIQSIDCFINQRSLSQDKSTWGQPAEFAATGWRNDPAKIGGGELIDTGYHPTYRLLFLAGARPTEVMAMLNTYRLPLEREDTADVLVKFENGVIGQIITSWAMPGPGSGETIFTVNGERGRLWAEPDKLYYQPNGFTTPSVLDFSGRMPASTFAAEIVHFVDAIEGGFVPLHSVAEATEVLQIILAAYRSTAEGTIVKL
jgi:predicted dehydrogenase